MSSQHTFSINAMQTHKQNPSAQQNVWTPTPVPVTGHLAQRRRRTTLMAALLVATLIIATVLGTANFLHGNSTLIVQTEGQSPMTIDLNQSVAVSPYLLGSNVFPKTGTDSKDAPNTGFMSYSPQIVTGLQSAHVRLLRFPGGNWGEEHTPSNEQLNDFSALLNQTGAEGIMQVQLTDPNDVTPVSSDVRATRASLLVDYMNNRTSIQRAGTNIPFHPVRYWTIGNEPDLLINPQTGKRYTVADYVNDFITFSIAMHQRDPSIKIFGPEISHYNGTKQEPVDANGALWMEDFLRGIASYERSHSLPFHILDGVSFHSYPFGGTAVAANTLLNNPTQWNTTIPALRQFIRDQFGANLPLAITEINSNSGKNSLSQELVATWWAETLGELMNNGVEYVAFFSTQGVSAPYPLFSQQGLGETSLLRVMQLFAHLQNNSIPLQVQNGPVHIYATQDDAHHTVSLLLVNRTATEQQISIHTDSVLPISVWHNDTLRIHGYAMMILTLHRNGSNDAQLFDNNNTSTQQTSELQDVTCNNMTDGRC